MPARKKGRLGLPLQLELAVSFLAAGDLSNFAAASKACRRVAFRSFRSRLQTSLIQQIHPANNTSTPPPSTTSTEFWASDDASFRFYHHPWWTCKRKQDGLLDKWCNSNRITFRRNGSWTMQHANENAVGLPGRPPRNVLKVLSGRHLCLPQTYQNQLQAGAVHIRHCSCLNKVLVVVFCKTTTVSIDIDMMDPGVNFNPSDPNTRNQLVVVVYNLNDKRRTVVEDPDNVYPTIKVYPTICQTLGPPVGRATYGLLGNCKYGTCSRSANGRALAVVTALPGEDHGTGDFFRTDSEITLFDLQSGYTSLKRRCSVNVPCGGYFDSGGVSIALSNKGDVISVTTAFSEVVGIFWGVYDITKDKPKSLFQVDHLPASTSIVAQLFSPDNELMLRVADGDRADIQKFIQETNFPFFATRIIFLVDD